MFFEKLKIFGQVWGFMNKRKKWWLLPVVLFLIVLALFLIIAESSVLGPLIYTIF